uniref:Uncharacterized protein n=1 Tax=Cannabis sativa TaxID=3483 RepID=A0A803QPI2_CANSA
MMFDEDDDGVRGSKGMGTGSWVSGLMMGMIFLVRQGWMGSWVHVEISLGPLSFQQPATENGIEKTCAIATKDTQQHVNKEQSDTELNKKRKDMV